MAQRMRVATVQFEHRADDTAYNMGRVAHFTREAATAGVDLVVCPEMCLLGYWHLRRHDAGRLRELAEPADGPLVRGLAELAVRHGIGVGAGFLERAGDGKTDDREIVGGGEVGGDKLFNSYAVCLPDGQVHIHRKLHAFEHEAISSGDRYTVFDTPWGVRMAVLICYDNNLVENVRASALLGATVLLAPHQTGGTASRSPRGMRPVPMAVWDNRRTDPAAVEREFRGPKGRGWLMRWLPSRAHDNGLFLVFSNGVGRDDDEVRTGNAMIIDPYGEILAETWVAEDAMVLADLDLTEVPLSTGRRWLAARRPDLYSLLTRSQGIERDARAARFSTDPVNVTGVGVAGPVDAP